MWVRMRARQPHGERWPTEGELVRDVLTSPAFFGICSLGLGIGIGVSLTLAAMSAGRPWQPLVMVMILLAILVGGTRLVLASFYEQEVKPRATRNEHA